MTVEIVTATAILPRLGHAAFPEPTGTNESGAFTWDLYAIDIEDPNAGSIIVDKAMTETDMGVYVVAMVNGVDDHDPLREPLGQHRAANHENYGWNKKPIWIRFSPNCCFRIRCLIDTRVSRQNGFW